MMQHARCNKVGTACVFKLRSDVLDGFGLVFLLLLTKAVQLVSCSVDMGLKRCL